MNANQIAEWAQSWSGQVTTRTLETARAEGYAQGYDQGDADGYKRGYEDGLQCGLGGGAWE